MTTATRFRKNWASSEEFSFAQQWLVSQRTKWWQRGVFPTPQSTVKITKAKDTTVSYRVSSGNITRADAIKRFRIESGSFYNLGPQLSTPVDEQLTRLAGFDPSILAAVRVLVGEVAAAGVSTAPWIAGSEDGSVGIDWSVGQRRLLATFDSAEDVALVGVSSDGDMRDIATPTDAAKWLLDGLQP